MRGLSPEAGHMTVMLPSAFERAFGRTESPDVLALCDRAEEHINNRAFSDEDEDELPAESSGLAAPARPAFCEIFSQRDPFEDVAAGN